MIHVCLSIILCGMQKYGVTPYCPGWMEVILGSTTSMGSIVCWISYWENWRRSPRVRLCFLFSPLSSISQYTLPDSCFSLCIIDPSRLLDAVLISLSSLQADPAYEAIHYSAQNEQSIYKYFFISSIERKHKKKCPRQILNNCLKIPISRLRDRLTSCAAL